MTRVHIHDAAAADEDWYSEFLNANWVEDFISGKIGEPEMMLRMEAASWRMKLEDFGGCTKKILEELTARITTLEASNRNLSPDSVSYKLNRNGIHHMNVTIKYINRMGFTGAQGRGVKNPNAGTAGIL